MSETQVRKQIGSGKQVIMPALLRFARRHKGGQRGLRRRCRFSRRLRGQKRGDGATGVGRRAIASGGAREAKLLKYVAGRGRARRPAPALDLGIGIAATAEFGQTARSGDADLLDHFDVVVALAIVHVARALGRRLGRGNRIVVGRVVDDATRRHCAILDW